MKPKPCPVLPSGQHWWHDNRCELCGVTHLQLLRDVSCKDGGTNHTWKPADANGLHQCHYCHALGEPEGYKTRDGHGTPAETGVRLRVHTPTPTT